MADKQSLFCEGIKSILSQHPTYKFSITSEVSHSDQVITIATTQDIDLIVMDINLTGIDGLELIPKIRAVNQDVKIIVLTAYSDYKIVRDAMKGGADAYLLKTINKTDMFAAINTVMKDKTYLGPDVNITPPNGFKINSKAKLKFEDRFLIKRKLTKRENQVLGLITQAKNNKEIAEELFISDQTVGVHRKNIMKKFGVRNTVNLIKYAFENQLFS